MAPRRDEQPSWLLPTERIQRAPSAAGRTRRFSGYGLPAELMAKARRRVAGVALGMSVIHAFGFFITLRFENPPLQTVQVLGVAVGVALFLAARSERLRHPIVLDLGAAFAWFCCLIDSLGVPAFIYAEEGYIPVLTWTCLYIVLYPLIIPSPPLKVLVTALASALMVPAGLLILDAQGTIVASASEVVAASVNPGICVVIATLAAQVVHGINRAAAEAMRLGSYQLESALGEGGMGEVWRARHRLLARPAAIKLISAEMLEGEGAQETLRRFEREAQVTAQLTSPHTVELYDFGTTTDGRFYYVMELLEGLDLDTLVERSGPLPAERAVYLLIQACASLEEAHRAGLVHRDVKPANLMVCTRGLVPDFVKVLDFGLVAPVKELVSPEDSGVLGTPAYMAPELLREQDSCDGRIDIYALGCVAYVLLTGRLVFEHSDVMDIVRAHLHDIPQPPSTLAPHPVPPELDALVLACLKKRPEERPQSARELAKRLEAIPLVEPWSSARAAAWWARRPPSPSGRILPDTPTAPL